MTTYLYMTTLKTIALNIQTFVSKVISLLFNMLSRFVIAFLPKSKYFIISWLKSLLQSQVNPGTSNPPHTTLPCSSHSGISDKKRALERREGEEGIR